MFPVFLLLPVRLTVHFPLFFPTGHHINDVAGDAPGFRDRIIALDNNLRAAGLCTASAVAQEYFPTFSIRYRAQHYYEYVPFVFLCVVVFLCLLLNVPLVPHIATNVPVLFRVPIASCAVSMLRSTSLLHPLCLSRVVVCSVSLKSAVCGLEMWANIRNYVQYVHPTNFLAVRHITERMTSRLRGPPFQGPAREQTFLGKGGGPLLLALPCTIHFPVFYTPRFPGRACC